MSKASSTKERVGASILDAFLACESSLKRFIGRFLYRPEDINDMAQETFLRAFSALDDKVIDSPRAYLFRVAKTMALKELTRKSRQLTDYLEEAQDSILDGETSLEEELVAEQKVHLFLGAIAELPPQCRRVFLMRKVQALSHKEIARQLDITVSAVEKHIALGAERCKIYVERREQGLMPTETAVNVLE